ncbi:TPA: hypothetical protein ACQ3AP_000032 [Klebsiella pneumoniae]
MTKHKVSDVLMAQMEKATQTLCQAKPMLYDDVTGVLMQCISRIPLSYRRKAKTPQGRGFRHVQIVASHRCHRGAALPIMDELSKLPGENQC